MDKKIIKKSIGIVSLIVIVAGVIAGSTLGYLIFYPQFHPEEPTKIYIDKNDTSDSIIVQIEKYGNPKSIAGFKWVTRWNNFNKRIHTGCYIIMPKDNVHQLYKRLSRGHQEPVKLIISNVRTIDILARNIGDQLMLDSAEISTILHDSIYLEKIGYNKETIPALFIPDTYQVYWNMSMNGLMKRMINEHKKFWNQKRLKQATDMGLSPIEVATLASIVEEETNNKAEMPMVAGLYYNRIKRGIPLQADPTIKFAMQDFTLRRILNEHLQIQSPYNTYLNIGLPPGPIRIPSRIGLESVLNYKRHNYIYMCAKEDFSGTHRFARTLSEHNRNAARYRSELNKRKIYK